MLTNDILRRVRYALDLKDAAVREIFTLAGRPIRDEELRTIFTKEDEEGFEACPDSLARAFFNGLIIMRRGPSEKTGGDDVPASSALTNNDVLWYLRIAMKMRDDDVHAILEKVDVHMGKSEMSALFRKKGHDNYRACGDQFLRNFLAGFTATYRAT